jgi:hypothetical protein
MANDEIKSVFVHAELRLPKTGLFFKPLKEVVSEFYSCLSERHFRQSVGKYKMERPPYGICGSGRGPAN